MGKYTGKVVMLERAEPSKEHSSYYDGEYLIYQETDRQVWGVDLTSRYGGINVAGLAVHLRNGLPLTGPGRYNVVSVSEPPHWVSRDIETARRDITDVIQGRKKAQFVADVYPRALNALEKVEEAVRGAGQKDVVNVTNVFTLDPSPAVNLVGPTTVALKVPAGYVLEPVLRKV